jgi:hypothetical protein
MRQQSRTPLSLRTRRWIVSYGAVAVGLILVPFVLPRVAAAASDTPPPTTAPAVADTRAPAGRLPVKEVTAFKDGHAYVLHEGELPVTSDGRIVVDDLPAPVLGTFWPYVAQDGLKLRSVVSGYEDVARTRDTTSLRDMLRANPGARVVVTEMNGTEYAAELVRVTEPRPATDPSVAAPPGVAPPPAGSCLVWLKREAGIRVIPVEAIRDVTFRDPPHDTLTDPQRRGVLTLQVEGSAPRAKVGYAYVQRGLRWIPFYRVQMDENGQARFALWATLVNDLTDLDDVTVHLVVGVPRFRFTDTTDPIALDQALDDLRTDAARLSRGYRRDSRTAYAFSNAIMSQQVQVEPGDMGPGGPPPDDDVLRGSRAEDLFVFTVEHVKLKKGQRMVVPVDEFNLPYESAYVLKLPAIPPPEARERLGQAGNSDERELAALFSAPKVQHMLRVTNSGKAPLTTAPVLVLKGGQVLAQGMTTYTPIGMKCDIGLTDALDVAVSRKDTETGRTPNALRSRNTDLTRIECQGVLTLANRKNTPVRVEITRYVFGQIKEASADGQVDALGWYDEEIVAAGAAGGRSDWWHWYSFPWWFNDVNGIGRVRWNVELKPGEKADLSVTWAYLWG